jgi:hypothetical protein
VLSILVDISQVVFISSLVINHVTKAIKRVILSGCPHPSRILSLESNAWVLAQGALSTSDLMSILLVANAWNP